MRRPSRGAVAVLGVLLLAVACRPSPPPPPERGPRLVLFIVVDQMRGDYLDRFGPLFEGGLARLSDESVWFTDAHHEQAPTTTAPGHATLATGCHPGRHGIVDNYWFDRETRERVYCAADPEYRRSPRNLLLPTLGDHLKSQYSVSKVYGVGGKDRSAILTAGRLADAAYWYDSDDGAFTSSGYYGGKTPAWLDELHDERSLDRHFGEAWSPLLPLEEMADYDIEPVDWGFLGRQFPHPLGGPSLAPSEGFYDAVFGSPLVDAYVVELTKALLAGEELGEDGYPDFLGVTLSAMDSVGHTFGPHSPELLDTLMRLDRVLGDLLDFIDQRIGLESVVVSLSSDHGVGPMPELLAERGFDARRLGTEEAVCFQRVGRRLRETFGDEEWLMRGLYLDRELVEETGVERAALVAELRRGLEACPRVERVLSTAELAAAGDDLDPIAQRYRNSYHPERSADLAVQFEEHTLGSTMAASHGSAHGYDTHVPWLLRLPSGAAGVVEERVATVDVVATLLGILGLEPQVELDGVDRRPLVERPRD